jgi:hypothetical protein
MSGYPCRGEVRDRYGLTGENGSRPPACPESSRRLVIRQLAPPETAGFPGHLRHPDEREEGPERLVPVLDDFGDAPTLGCQDRAVSGANLFSCRTQEIRYP